MNILFTILFILLAIGIIHLVKLLMCQEDINEYNETDDSYHDNWEDGW